MKDIDEIFDNRKIEKSIKKARYKSTVKITCIALVVFILGTILNFYISVTISERNYEKIEAITKISVPGGYISESYDVFSLLGGSGNYKVAKKVGGRIVILEDRTTTFGLSGYFMYSRTSGHSGNYKTNEWPTSFYNNGYKKLNFYHPETEYEKLQNDLANIEKVPDGKVIEMAISFDKPYSVLELDVILSNMSPAKPNWIWLDEGMNGVYYPEEYKEDYSTIVSENNAIGVPIRDIYMDRQSYEYAYNELVENLGKSYDSDHQNLYNKIRSEGKTKVEDAKALGVIVQGTKEELKQLIGNPKIRATSFGIIIDEVF